MCVCVLRVRVCAMSVHVVWQAVRKLHSHLKAVKEAAVERGLPQPKPITLTPQEQTLDEDLDEAAQVEHQLTCR